MRKLVLSVVALSATLLGPGSPAVPVATRTLAVTTSTRVFTVMPLGDSITRGGGQVHGQYIGYRARLQAHLRTGATGFRYDFVGSRSDLGAPDRDHEGHGGWTIDDLAAVVDARMRTYRPDIVLLHAGTNNITLGDAPDVTAAKLAGLIARIRSHNPNTRIFVAKITRSRDPRRQPRTDAYAALIPGVVAHAGPNVHLVDQTSVSGTDIFDWTHPNDFGYAKMAYNWYGAMNVVVGQGMWKAVASPYRVRTAYICQIPRAGAPPVCRTRAVN